MDHIELQISLEIQFNYAYAELLKKKCHRNANDFLEEYNGKNFFLV